MLAFKLFMHVVQYVMTALIYLIYLKRHVFDIFGAIFINLICGIATNHWKPLLSDIISYFSKCQTVFRYSLSALSVYSAVMFTQLSPYNCFIHLIFERPSGEDLVTTTERNRSGRSYHVVLPVIKDVLLVFFNHGGRNKNLVRMLIK